MDWDKYFINICKAVAEKSKDPSTKVGCIIVGPDKGTRSTGYNGFPRGIADSFPKHKERYERPIKYQYTVHAEANAILYAARTGISLNNCSLYVSGLFPCSNCGIMIIQAGIKEVVYFQDKPYTEEWEKSFSFTKKLFDEVNIKYKQYGDTNALSSNSFTFFTL